MLFCYNQDKMDNFEGTTAIDLGLLTTDRLKDICRKRNIKMSGRKAELVERLVVLK